MKHERFRDGRPRRAGLRLVPAAALLALASALLAPAGPASATTGADLMNVCAPGGAAPPLPACYAYVHAIIDDANLVGADVDRRFVEGFGLFCAPQRATIDDAIAGVVRALRADPSLRDHSAAIAVRVALPKVYPCTPQMLRRRPPSR